MSLTIAQIAQQLSGEFVGDGSTLITGFAAAEGARTGDLTFAERESFLLAAEQSAASAILVPPRFASTKKPLIRVENPRTAMARLLPILFPPERHPPGIHPTAVIDPTALIHPSVQIGPHCVIGPRVRVGERSVLMGGNYVSSDCELGADVCLFPNVIIYARTCVGHRVTIHAGTVIGSDGYGYVFDGGHHRKILQMGNVVIGDDVEIGANAAIDRAALGSTIIGHGTKIDNLVHVAHNVVMGSHCLVMGQVGFAGSTKLGDYCVVASQSGIAGHLTLGRQATVGAKSGVMRDVPDGETVLGIPAMPDRQTKRQWIGLQQLPEMIRKMRQLEQQVLDLRLQITGDRPSTS
jgi:UDP-3-O-[3-hydroxymyristoyl] glucosamine N-acyltransferase